MSATKRKSMDKRARRVVAIHAVLYDRISSRDQDKGFSLAAQNAKARQWAAKKGLTVLREFRDIQTAKQPGRKEFDEMCAFATKYAHKEGRRLAIIVEKTDRLIRNGEDEVTLNNLPIEIHFVNDNKVISPESNSSDMFMYHLQVAQARHYIANLSEETRKGMTQKAREGLYPSHAPAGYRNTEINENGIAKKVIVPDEVWAPVITRAFELYAHEDLSLSTLLSKLKAEFGKPVEPLHRSVLAFILKNTVYYGEFEWNGKRYKGTHEPLITKELYVKVNEKLIGRSHSKSKLRQGPPPWLFWGVLTCGICGCAIVGELKKKTYIYYSCKQKGCQNNKVMNQQAIAAQVDPAVLSLCGFFDCELLQLAAEILSNKYAGERRRIQGTIAEQEKRLDEIARALDAAIEKSLLGNFSEDDLSRMRPKWNQERVALDGAIAESRQKLEALPTDVMQLAEILSKFPELYRRQNDSRKRELLKAVLDKCEVREGTVAVRFRKPFAQLLSGKLRREASVAVSAPASTTNSRPDGRNTPESSACEHEGGSSASRETPS